jgi:hypothetical protein
MPQYVGFEVLSAVTIEYDIFGFSYHVVRRELGVSEAYIASVFRTEE